MIRALATADETDALGQVLARALPPIDHSPAGGAQLHLSGPLGSGKTTLVRALLRSLGVSGPVRSPTYTLVETYDGGVWQVVHFDLYRIAEVEELELLGAREYFAAGCLCCVEWPERAAAWLPRPDLAVALEFHRRGRRARLRADSTFGSTWLAEVT